MVHQSHHWWFDDDWGSVHKGRASCFRELFVSEKHHHTGSPRLWFDSLAKCHSGADVSCMSLIIGQQGQRAGLTRCIVLILMANTGKSWLGFLVEILLNNSRAVDKSRKKIKLVSFPFSYSQWTKHSIQAWPIWIGVTCHLFSWECSRQDFSNPRGDKGGKEIKTNGKAFSLSEQGP